MRHLVFSWETMRTKSSRVPIKSHNICCRRNYERFSCHLLQSDGRWCRNQGWLFSQNMWIVCAHCEFFTRRRRRKPSKRPRNSLLVDCRKPERRSSSSRKCIEFDESSAFVKESLIHFSSFYGRESPRATPPGGGVVRYFVNVDAFRDAECKFSS
jgi:hypothetical protein